MTERGSGGLGRSILDGISVGSAVRATVRSILGFEHEPDPCTCRFTFDENQLMVNATDCDGQGDLAASIPCRRAVINALTDRSVTEIRVVRAGLEVRYCGQSASLLSAAGRFVELLGTPDARITNEATTNPLVAGRAVRTRIDHVGSVGTESELTQVVSEIDDTHSIEVDTRCVERSNTARCHVEDVLSPTVGLTIGYYFVDPAIDAGATVRSVTSLPTGSEVRIYQRPTSVPLYSVDVVDVSLSRSDRLSLLDAYEVIADGGVSGDRAPSRALESVGVETVDPTLTATLTKHTSGYGILEDLFADPRVTDVYTSSPVSRNPLRVVVDGESMLTNVHLSPNGARALASRVRRTSGRAFSRANPTVDATATLDGGTGVRIAGVTEPVSDGMAFAFREKAADRFTLPALVANGTLSADVAGFLSVAVERNAATLVAGTRGSGKTTLLGTLLYELPPDTRTIVIEDTPELPVESLQTVDRDVQALRTGTGDGPEITAAEALRTALRLGDGALVVGEIRGREAAVLYEAMRVGANANAVLGTIHGDGADDVYERVVSDLDVPPSSFAVTDLVVTTQSYQTASGRSRRVARVEEIVGSGADVWFESLYALDGERATATGRIDRGESRFVNQLVGPSETYAAIRKEIERRSARLAALAADGRTSPSDVAGAYAGSRLEFE